MRPDRLECLTRWGAAALLLLLIHGVCALDRPGPAATTWSFSNSDRLLRFNQLDALVAGDSPAVLDELPSDLPGERGSKRPAPCSGPGCSSRVPMPVPTTIPAPDGTDQWGALSVPVILPAASPLDRMTDEPAPDSSREESSIFHPPRV